MRKLLLHMGVLLWASVAHAEDLNVSLAEIPNLSFYNEENRLVGAFPLLVELLDDHYTEGKFNLKAYPFARSINNVIVGRADVHLPLIMAGAQEQMPFRYVDEPLLNVTFVIYSHKDKPVFKTDDFSRLAVDTMIGHKRFFDIKVEEVIDFETGLKKVINKRVDAFIMEQDAVDKLVRLREYDSIHRAHYRTWPSALIVAKSRNGDALNKKLSAAIRKTRQDPRYRLLAQQVHAPFQDWQPYEQ